MNDWITPDWPAPRNVRALFTTRNGGVSLGNYASLNLGDHVGDEPSAVAHNRALLRSVLPGEPRWLKQVHGAVPIQVDDVGGVVEGDAAFSSRAGTVCAVLVADCLPVLLCDRTGSVVGVAHAGWRGLAAGVIERTAISMGSQQTPLLAWLGPAIGPNRFEVGEEVREAFIEHDQNAALAFAPHAHGKWLADLYLLARQRLAAVGVTEVYGGGECTFSDPARFFSHRRDGKTGNTGRMAGLIWLAE